MILILLAYWAAIFFVVQLVFFALFLYSLWSSIVKAVGKMQSKFSLRNFISCILEAIGEGEFQDSLMIGGIQYLLQDEEHNCKRCNQPLVNPDQQINDEDGGAYTTGERI
jgi:hypothetical protein